MSICCCIVAEFIFHLCIVCVYVFGLFSVGCVTVGLCSYYKKIKIEKTYSNKQQKKSALKY